MVKNKVEIRSVNVNLIDSKLGVSVMPGNSFYIEKNKITDSMKDLLERGRLVIGTKVKKIEKNDSSSDLDSNSSNAVNSSSEDSQSFIPEAPSKEDEKIETDLNDIPDFTKDDAENILNQNSKTVIKKVNSYDNLTKNDVKLIRKTEEKGKKRPKVLNFLKGLLN